MNKFKALIATLAVIAGAAGVTAVVQAKSVNAQAATPLCTLTPLNLSEYGKSFTKGTGKITAKFKLSGAANCKYDMTLATFKAKSGAANNGQPLAEQTLFNAATGTFGPGEHSLTASVPDCFYQVDIVTGKALKNTVGTRYFDYVNTSNFVNQGRLADGTNTAHIHDAAFGGTKSCDVPKEEVCPHDPSMKKNDPNCERCPRDPSMSKNDPKCEPCPYNPNMPKNDTENCKPPVETPQTPQGGPEPEVTQLPSTGAGSILASTMGLSTSAGLAVKYFRSRRLLK
jgi:LPXTG-motif cell wall-anchored protein